MNATVLAGLLLLAPAQPATLELKNIQATYGKLGPTRPAGKVLPGDNLFLVFDITGLTVKDGAAEYALSTEILSKGKLQYRQPAKDNKAILPFGGGVLQGMANFEIGLSTPAGAYEFKVTVTDVATKQTTSFTRTFEIAAPEFGIVRLNPTLDDDGEASTTLFGVGHTLWVNFSAVGFQRDTTPAKQPNLTFELTITDATGKSFTKPFAGTVDKDIPAMVAALPGQFPLPLNNTGKFTIEIKATDNLSKKTAKLAFPITVQGR